MPRGTFRSSRMRSGALALGVGLASLAVVAGAGSAPVVSKGSRRAKKATPAVPTVIVSVSASALPVMASAPLVASALSPPPAPSAVPPTIKLPISVGTRVLLFGDSFTDAGFSQRVRKLVEERGGTLVADGWTSATTKSWATKDRLPNLLFNAKPDVVIIVLGANEVFLGAPEKMAPYVRSIVHSLGTKPCAWVSPPLWKGETGIVSVTRTHSSPCAFFDSGALKMDKQPDGIHPTVKGGSTWADAFWSAIVSP